MALMKTIRHWTENKPGSGLNYLLISLISVIVAIVLGRMIEGTGMLIGLGVLALWELLAALSCFELSKGFCTTLICLNWPGNIFSLALYRVDIIGK